jgi:vitamin B12 transporter
MRPIILLVLALTAVAPPAAAQRPVPLDTMHVQAGSRLVAGAARMTRAVDILERAAIEALPARTVSDVIARGLGVDLQPRSPAQADVAIRGSSFEQVLVLVDGVSVNDLQTGHFHLDLAVPLDAVERIELLRGPAAAIYGSSAIGGVINIVTRRAVQEVSARAEGGSFGAHALAAEAALVRDAFGARLSASHDAADGHRPGTDHRTRQARIALHGGVARGTLFADAAIAARDFGADGFYAPFDSYEETRTGTASLSWRSAPARVTVEPRVSYRQHRDDFILLRNDPSYYRNRHTTHTGDAELVARWTPAADVTLAFGGSAARSTIDSNALGNRSEDTRALFAEAAAGNADRTLATVGLRYDHHETFGAFLSPQAAVGFRVSPRLLLRASAGTGFRAPSWTDRYYVDPANIGSPDLDAERFWTAEAGAALTLAALRLDAAAFVRRASDLIDWARPAGAPPEEPWRTLNVESATFRGAEIQLHAPAGPLLLTGRAALLSFDADETAGFVSKYALQPLTRSGSLEAGLPVLDRGLLAVRAAAARRADGVTWNVVDLRASVRLARIHFFADVTNLFDERWLDVSARPAPGRALSAGVRVRR